MKRAWTLATAIVIAAACSKKAGTPTSAPGGASDAAYDGAEVAEPEPGDAPRNIDELQAELEAVEADLRSVGVAVGKGDVAEAVPAADAEKLRCARVCELTEAMCDLETLICDLAAQHEGEPRYEDACERARDDCAKASEACNACSGS